MMNIVELNQIRDWVTRVPRQKSGIAFTDSELRRLAFLIEEREKECREDERQRILAAWERIKIRSYMNGGSLFMSKAFLDIKDEIEKGG